MTRHGTTTGYFSDGCRCPECHRAMSAHSGTFPVIDCSGYDGGKSSHCSRIASKLAEADAEVVRLGRLASRSAKSFARYGPQLQEAKRQREMVRDRRDAHMAECPAALDRFGGAA